MEALPGGRKAVPGRAAEASGRLQLYARGRTKPSPDVHSGTIALVNSIPVNRGGGIELRKGIVPEYGDWVRLARGFTPDRELRRPAGDFVFGSGCKPNNADCRTGMAINHGCWLDSVQKTQLECPLLDSHSSVERRIHGTFHECARDPRRGRDQQVERQAKQGRRIEWPVVESGDIRSVHQQIREPPWRTRLT